MTTFDDLGGSRSDHSPYVGPRPFRRTDAGRFFGRSLEARDVKHLWIGDQVTVLHGPAGVGKTSLLNAGVLPLLSEEPHVELLPVGGLGHESSVALAVQPPSNSYSFALLSDWARFEEPPTPGTSITDFLLARVPDTSGPSDPVHMLAAIDHFEELFTSFPARQAERGEFIDQLAEAVRRVSAIRLLIVINDEYLGELKAYERRLSPFPLEYIRLSSLSADTALDAITGPLRGTRREFAADVPQKIVDNLTTIEYTDIAGETAIVHSESVEPLLLQIACSDLWASVPDGTDLITSDHLQFYGQVDQALRRFYDAAIDLVRREMEQTEEQLRAWIESTFITEHGTRGTASLGLISTAGMPNKVADAFTEARILTKEYRARGTWFQLSHDRMIAAIRDANRTWRATRGLNINPPPPMTAHSGLIAAAEAALAAGNFPTAQTFAARAVDNYKADDDTRRMGYALTIQAEIAHAKGDLSAAEGYLQRAQSIFTLLEDRDLVARSLSALADVRFESGDYISAEQLQRDAVEQLPTYVDAIIGLGYAQWYEGSPADAAATFDQALGWDARAARAAGLRGQVLAEMEEYDTALVNLDSALQADPPLPPDEEVDAHSARALAFSGIGRDEEADRELAIARSQAPDRARTLRRAGKIAKIRAQNTLAAAEFRRALDADPPLPPWDQDNARRLLSEVSDGA
jgi:tetratricopeptide (TPR) repeat protein